MACILQSSASTILSRYMVALPGEVEANASGVACVYRHRVEEIVSAGDGICGGACGGARWKVTFGAAESLVRQVVVRKFVAWWVVDDRGISGWRSSRASAAPSSMAQLRHLHLPITFKQYYIIHTQKLQNDSHNIASRSSQINGHCCPSQTWYYTESIQTSSIPKSEDNETKAHAWRHEST